VTPERLREVIQADEDAWNAHDAQRLAALISSEMEFHTPSAPAVVHGRDAFREIAERYMRALPDFRIVNVPIAYADDPVVVLWRVTGTHQGPLLMELALTSRRSVWVELPASGHAVEVPGCSVIRVDENGLICRSEEYWNQAALLPQLGVRPFLHGAARAAVAAMRRSLRAG
jgi:steroid delta-isomerase-like uncharacterized protein